MRLPSKHETLRAALVTLADSGGKTWTEMQGALKAALNFAAVTTNDKDAKADLKKLGEKCSSAIAGLPRKRCNQLSEDEVCAYCQRGLTTMHPKLERFRDERKDETGAQKGYVLHEAPDGFHYFLKAIGVWWERDLEASGKHRRENIQGRWNSAKGLLVRLKSLEMREWENSQERASLEQAFKKANLAIADFTELRGFLVDLSHSLASVSAIEQPWIVNAVGEVVDSAWVTVIEEEELTALLMAGGRVENHSLDAALRMTWEDGEAWLTWNAIYQVAIEQARGSLDQHFSAMRKNKAWECEDLPPDRRGRVYP